MHADSTETVLSRLQNPPLNVPVQMVQELDIVAIQRQIFVDNRRVRRNMRISELGRGDAGVATSDVYRWDPGADRFEQADESSNLRDIMHLRGWDREELDAELDRRTRLLRGLVDRDVAGYEAFTSIIHRYNNDPDDVMARLEAEQLDRLT
jgi:flagellar protein FlaI